MGVMATAPPRTATQKAAGVDPRVTWRPSTTGVVARLAVLAVLLGAALAIPHLIPASVVNVYTRAMVYGVIALSMNVLIGYTGQVSLGHHAFVGVGAFSAGILLTRAALPWVAAVLVAVVLGSVISLGLGAVALRVKGLYFALVTIAYGLFVENTIFNITAITGGGAGMPAPRPGFAQSDIAYGYVALGALLLTWLFDWRLTSTRAGRAIQALRDDERVAASWGIDVKAHKLLAFSISGGMASLAGALFASTFQIVSPVTFSFTLGLVFVLMTVVGGVRSRPGVVLGGFLFATLPTLLKAAHDAWGLPDESADTLPPKLVQVIIGLALAGIVVERIVHAFPGGSLRARVLWVVLGVPVAVGFLLLVPAAFAGWVNIWEGVDDQLEPVIGAVLLLLTLTQYPGGIAQPFAPLFRWLSFKPLREHRVAATPTGGDARADA